MPREAGARGARPASPGAAHLAVGVTAAARQAEARAPPGLARGHSWAAPWPTRSLSFPIVPKWA